MSRAKDYAAAAPIYAAAGWRPVPLKPQTKRPALKGATGYEGKITDDDIGRWRTRYASNPVGVALQAEVGIDVDDYDDKHGAAQLADLVRDLGPLPRTYTSTARGSGQPSRQHLYRVPVGVRFKANAAPDIEVCRPGGNPAAVWPSRHPKLGTRYRWYGPNGERLDGPPDVSDLPVLPDAWVERLRNDREHAAGSPDATIKEWRARQRDGAPSKAALRARARIEREGTSYGDMYAAIGDLVRYGTQGTPGVLPLLEEARVDYLSDFPTYAEAFDNAVRDQVKAKGLPPVTLDAAPTVPPVQPIAVADCDDTFIAWLGLDYDLEALHVVLAVAAGERLTGDPAWLLLLSGSGFTKTETVTAVGGVGARIVSSIASEGALLSATSQGERSKDATGGLLREMGDRGTLIIKDVTTILSMDRTARGQVLAALREIYDGRWTRNVGTDGGRSLEWTGRLVVIGAVTTAWDRAHEVVASMGDRFVLVRMDSTKGRITAGRKAISNTGSEESMRAELAAAAAGVLAGVDVNAEGPDDLETDRILRAANVVTNARTAVDIDYKGNVIDSHAPEAPTRFAKQLAQVFRGAVAIGLTRERSLALAIRCARDSMPPLRLEILEDVAAHEWTRTTDVMKRLQKPRSTVDRQLQSLHLLGLLTVDEEINVAPFSQRESTTWRYSLAEDVDITSLTTTHPTK